MKYLPLKTLYRLYKANVGDVIDNTYVRLHGAFITNDSRGVSSNGLMTRSQAYAFTFRDLSDGKCYHASNGLSLAKDPNYPNQEWYNEPFTVNTIDPFPVFEAYFQADASTTYYTEDMPN